MSVCVCVCVCVCVFDWLHVLLVSVCSASLCLIHNKCAFRGFSLCRLVYKCLQIFALYSLYIWGFWCACVYVCVCVCFSLSALLVGVSVWEMLCWLCIAWRWQQGPEGWSSVKLLSPFYRLTLQPWLITVIHQQKVSVPTCLSPLPVHLLLSRTQFYRFAAELLKLSFRECMTACFVWSYKEIINCDTSRWGLCVFNSLLLFLSLSRVGQSGGQGDRDPCSGSSAPWEEPTDAGAADETPGQVGGEHHTPSRLQSIIVALRQTLCTADTETARWLILAVFCAHIAVILLSLIVVVVVHPRGGLRLRVISWPHALRQRVLKIETMQQSPGQNYFPTYPPKPWLG